MYHTVWMGLFEGALHQAPLENPQRILDIGTGTGEELCLAPSRTIFIKAHAQGSGQLTWESKSKRKHVRF